jgi:flavin-dependent dehydrogenase
MAGFIPTNDGAVLVCVGAPPNVLRTHSYEEMLRAAAPDARDRLAAASPPQGLRRFTGIPGYVRSATGPGWALVGDAGYFKDPLSTHGITDALRDAELLARAVIDGSIERYPRERDRLSQHLFDVTDELASYRWDTADVQRLLLALSSAMTDEIETLLALDERTVRTLSA